jgi:hypothetical protein
VVFHAEHLVRPSRLTNHVIHTCAAGGTAFDVDALSMRGPWWPSRVADCLARFDPMRRIGRAGPSCAGLLPTLSADAELLTSWIIAPV